MLPLQVNTAFSVSGAVGVAKSVALGPPKGGAPVLEGRDDAPSNRAARPGPPTTRLEFRTQNQSQGAAPEGDKAGGRDRAEGDAPTAAGGEQTDASGLTEAERREVQKLQARDREVREHERAHATAGGAITGSPSYTFVRGPDGRQYAVSGEVSIDTSPVSGNPEATIRKMEQVKRAALAPRNPSSQDRRVASQADAAMLKARQEIAEEQREAQAEEAKKRAEAVNGDERALGQGGEAAFDPEKRFDLPVGSASSPLGTGLAGRGELSMNTGVLGPGDLFDLVA